jgi:hypothetical protein
MNTLLVFLHALKPNLPYLFLVFTYFFLTFLVGFIQIRFFIKTAKLYFLIPAAVIVGILTNILFLALFSYWLKGPIGILLINGIYVISSLFLIVKRPALLHIDYPKLSLSTFIIAGLWSCFLLFLFFTAGNNTYGGDVIAYWGFATSFANGNYPLRSPWQPDLLATHHQGGYLYEGAIFALTNVNIGFIHSLFSVLVIAGGFFLLWGIIRLKTQFKIWSIIPAIIFYISFGAIFVPIPERLATFISNDTVIQKNEGWPIFTDVKNRLGGSSNLNEIFYINHRAAAFAGMFLIFCLLTIEWRISDRWKLVVITCLLVVVISIDEVVLPSLLLGGGWWWLWQLKLTSKKKSFFISSVIAALVSVCLFFGIGSALRDSLLTPSIEAPRFQVVFDIESFLLRFKEMSGVWLLWKEYYFYQPNLIAYFVVALVLVLYLRQLELSMYFMASVGSLLGLLLIEHTYYPGNQGRFLHLIYLILSLIIIEAALFLFKLNIKAKLLGSLLIFCFSISVITTGIYLLYQAKSDNYPNLKGTMPTIAALHWFRQNHPNDRVIFIDGFLNNSQDSYLNINAIQYFGLKVPLSPAKVKVHTPDIGVEATDLITTLNPQDFTELNTYYLFIKHDQMSALPHKRQIDLLNTQFFMPIYEDSDGIYYHVLPDFIRYGQSISAGSIRKISDVIPPNTDVFLDDPYNINSALRAVLWLRLKDSNSVYTEWRSGIFNYIETKMVFYDPLKRTAPYQYLIVGPKIDPLTKCNCSKVEMVWQMNAAKGYRVIR